MTVNEAVWSVGRVQSSGHVRGPQVAAPAQPAAFGGSEPGSTNATPAVYRKVISDGMRLHPTATRALTEVRTKWPCPEKPRFSPADNAPLMPGPPHIFVVKDA